MSELKVYYGWARIGNVRKKRAISVMFENEWHGCRSERGQRILRAAHTIRSQLPHTIMMQI